MSIKHNRKYLWNNNENNNMPAPSARFRYARDELLLHSSAPPTPTLSRRRRLAYMRLYQYMCKRILNLDATLPDLEVTALRVDARRATGSASAEGAVMLTPSSRSAGISAIGVRSELAIGRGEGGAMTPALGGVSGTAAAVIAAGGGL